MTAFGLTALDREVVFKILETCPRLESATLFGSRAKGNFRPGSDVDLALAGKALTFSDELDLMHLFDESSLPFRFDLVRLETDLLPELKAHIERVGIKIYERSSKPTKFFIEQ